MTLDTILTPFEIVEVRGMGITVDLLVWRRYRRRTTGVVELMMEMNPEIARAHRFGPFLPVGLVVKLPIVQELLDGGATTKRAVTLYGTTRS
jgi:phage tail protein X